MRATRHLILNRSWVVPVASGKYGNVPRLGDDEYEWGPVEFAYDSTTDAFRVLKDGHVIYHSSRIQGSLMVLAPTGDPRSAVV